MEVVADADAAKYRLFWCDRQQICYTARFSVSAAVGADAAPRRGRGVSLFV
jgi:hypothetical protein